MLEIRPLNQSKTFRVNGIRSSRPQLRALEFERNLKNQFASLPNHEITFDDLENEKIQWYLEDGNGKLLGIATTISFSPFSNLNDMPYPLRYLLRRKNFAQLIGEQIHFTTRTVFTPEKAANNVMLELTREICEYFSLCCPGTLILNLDRLDLVTHLVIDAWQVYGKCNSDIYGEHHTVLLGKQTGIDFFTTKPGISDYGPLK